MGREVKLIIKEDNQATIKVAKTGYSAKLRNITRHHKVDLGSIAEELENQNIDIEYCKTEEQCADVFTKGLEPQKWPNALELIGIRCDKADPNEPIWPGRRTMQDEVDDPPNAT